MADRYQLEWVDHTGEVWSISALGWVAGIRADGIEGLVGSPTDVAVTAPGEPGQVVESQQIPPLSGALRFAVRGDGARSAADVAAALRVGFSHRKVGEVRIRGGVLGPLSARVRRAGEVPPPSVDPGSEEVILGLDVPVAADDGCWWTEPVTSTNIATVTNSGDVPVWVEIEWVGPGGRVVLPSGASFVLPAVSEARVLSLSRAESMIVTNADGVVDHALWRQLRGEVLPETVPVDQSRTFQLPEGASLTYRMGVLDPWR